MEYINISYYYNIQLLLFYSFKKPIHLCTLIDSHYYLSKTMTKTKQQAYKEEFIKFIDMMDSKTFAQWIRVERTEVAWDEEIKQ